MQLATFDVVILGGGIAGLTLARHLRKRLGKLSVCVVERTTSPLPRFAHKVGESALGPQGWYLGDYLGLREYLDEAHVHKWGVRFFFQSPETGDGDVGDFASRPELGAGKYVGIPEWQFDRGRLEQDLRTMNVESGVRVLEGEVVSDCTLAEAPTEEHVITCRSVSDPKGGERVLRARWVVDATGRARFLRRRLPVEQGAETRGPCSAAWWRSTGWVDVEDFVSADHREWKTRIDRRHPKCPTFGRVNSTNHLCGDGYWVWLIPLPDDGMSIGIVAHEAHQPFSSFNTYEKALSWLRRNEPRVAQAIDGREPLDFKVMHRYSYPSTPLLSERRWARTGEAVAFSDPLYSPGGDTIALANFLVAESIALETEGALTPEICSRINTMMTRHVSGYTRGIQSIYPCLGYSRLASCHVVWDFVVLVSNTVLTLHELSEGGLRALSDDAFVAYQADMHRIKEKVDAYIADCVEEARAGNTRLGFVRPGHMVQHSHAFPELMRIAYQATVGQSGDPEYRKFMPPLELSQRLALLDCVGRGLQAYLSSLRTDAPHAGAGEPTIARMISVLRSAMGDE